MCWLNILYDITRTIPVYSSHTECSQERYMSDRNWHTSPIWCDELRYSGRWRCPQNRDCNTQNQKSHLKKKFKVSLYFSSFDRFEDITPFALTSFLGFYFIVGMHLSEAISYLLQYGHVIPAADARCLINTYYLFIYLFNWIMLCLDLYSVFDLCGACIMPVFFNYNV